MTITFCQFYRKKKNQIRLRVLNISLHVGEEIQRLQQDLHEHNFLLRGDYLNPATFYQNTCRKSSKAMYIRVGGISFTSFPMIILSDCGTVLKVWCILKKARQYIGHEKRTWTSNSTKHNRED